MLTVTKLRDMAERMLMVEILPFWMNLKDEKYGGFYGYVSNDKTIDTNAPKGVILHSRILWTFSAAYRITGNAEYLIFAKHAYRFLIEKATDTTLGGLYWMIDRQGTPLQTFKHSYNQAFGIYAMATYYLASGESDALQAAMKLFALLEQKWRHDKGYLEQLTVDFKPANNEELSENGCMADMTMNTVLHIMEAYTLLYEATESQQVLEALRFNVDLLTGKMYNKEKKRLEVFFDKDMKSLLDLHSYGHDIEASWLIDRAASVIGDPDLMADVLPITNALYQHVMQTAYAGRGIYFESENGRVDTKRDWWVQAEAVVGIVNAMQKSTFDEASMGKAESILHFIRTEVMHTSGEWYWSTYEDGSHDGKRELAGPWKCPYHNARMCMEIMKRI